MAQEDALVSISADGVELERGLIVPSGAEGPVVFAHGSGSRSSRHSPRNDSVAETLRERELGTLLFDPLTAAADWFAEHPG